MGISAGNLNAKVRIERRFDKQDTAGQQSEEWRTLASRRANIRVKGATEGKSLTGEVSSTIYEIKLRRDSVTKTISPSDRVIDMNTGNVYDVESADDMLSMNKLMTLRCKYISRGVEQMADNDGVLNYDLPLKLG